MLREGGYHASEAPLSDLEHSEEPASAQLSGRRAPKAANQERVREHTLCP